MPIIIMILRAQQGFGGRMGFSKGGNLLAVLLRRGLSLSH